MSAPTNYFAYYPPVKDFVDLINLFAIRRNAQDPIGPLTGFNYFNGVSTVDLNQTFLPGNSGITTNLIALNGKDLGSLFAFVGPPFTATGNYTYTYVNGVYTIVFADYNDTKTSIGNNSSSGTITFTKTINNAYITLVGGGGGGGGGCVNYSGGGGAGGCYNSYVLQLKTDMFTVTVGAGGQGGAGGQCSATPGQLGGTTSLVSVSSSSSARGSQTVGGGATCTKVAAGGTSCILNSSGGFSGAAGRSAKAVSIYPGLPKYYFAGGGAGGPYPNVVSNEGGLGGGGANNFYGATPGPGNNNQGYNLPNNITYPRGSFGYVAATATTPAVQASGWGGSGGGGPGGAATLGSTGYVGGAGASGILIICFKFQ